MGLEAFDITRVARVTGLDRCGVEVACAIRPTGHILQVANGKGLTFAQAAARARAEAAEMWAAEQVDPARLRWDSWDALQASGARALSPLELGSAGACEAPTLWSPRLRLAWTPAVDLFSGQPLWVPAQAVHCLREGDWALGPQLVSWTTNGMGAHPRRDGALLHALLEAIERDQLAHALPQGWMAGAIARRMLTLAGAPQVSRLAQKVETRGFDVFLFDLTPPNGLGLPLAGALLFDSEEGPVPLTAGYACHVDVDRALLGALLEAAQSRLTDVHGAREDVTPMNREEATSLRRMCLAVKPRLSVRRRAASRDSSALGQVKRKLWAAGHRVVAVVNLTRRESPLRVVKVIIPGLQVSGLL